MGQLPLALRLAQHADFDTFEEGANGPALAHVRGLVAGPGGQAIWLSGVAAAGKSHALQAACRAAGQTGKRSMYLPLAHPDVSPDLMVDLDGLDFVALDDLDRIADTRSWQAGLFRVLNSATAGGCALLMAARMPPTAVAFSLPDLASRAASGAVYRLQPLADDDQRAALLRHAHHRGLKLDPGVARYLQTRVPRDMAMLMAWLERLDVASLAAQRRITLPFVREQLLRSADGPRRDIEQGEFEE